MGHVFGLTHNQKKYVCVMVVEVEWWWVVVVEARDKKHHEEMFEVFL